jgi:hypothetical protein
MTPIQQLMLGVGAKKKVFLDDIFSTYIYNGTGSAQTINNGIDLSSEGGLVWTKVRNNTWTHALLDTVRGGSKRLRSNTTSSESTYTDLITAFNNNGYTLGNDATTDSVNNSGDNYASWTFRKSPMFDVVTYTGTGNSPNADSHLDINHSLGSVPGMVIVKRTSGSSDWWVWHRDLATNNAKAVFLDKTDTATSHSSYWNGTAPTASQFTVGEYLNVSGSTYVAYLFGGGESTAATARSVDFDGSGDYLSIPDSSDFDIGSSEFTIEGWIKVDALNSTGAGWLTSWSSSSQRGWYFGTSNTNKFVFSWSDTGSNINSIDSGYTVKADGQFHHYAVTRSGTTLYFYLDGLLIKTNTGSGDTFHNSTGPVAVGYNPDGGSGWELNGKISNLRFVKGTAVYTSSFKPPTKPLTNITNTKLLCCNNSSTTGSTVTPGTITANGNPTASSDSPFDDPAGFVFGESGSENVIKTGSHSNSVTEAVRIYTGWEPQWLMIKNTSQSSNWAMFDVMRGIFVGVDDQTLAADTSDAENGVVGQPDAIVSHGDGFTLKYGLTAVNPGNGNKIIYIAIRRSDGYCGKPPELGAGVFAMDTGSSSGTIPTWDSGFPVDFALMRTPASVDNWSTVARLTGSKLLKTNTTNAEVAGGSDWVTDSNVGWGKSYNQYNQSWMWKRHAGFDVVCYEGNGTFGHVVNHSMNKTPEMIWLKERNSAVNWYVNHTALTGGGTYASWRGALKLNGTNAEWEPANVLGDFSTSTTFTLGGDSDINGNGDDYIAMLFASVDGISKVGSYSGSGSSGNAQNIGFQPRFLVVKRADDSGAWYTFDSLRVNFDRQLELNTSNTQDTVDKVTVSSTGWSFTDTNINENGSSYIYYAHS